MGWGGIRSKVDPLPLNRMTDTVKILPSCVLSTWSVNICIYKYREMEHQNCIKWGMFRRKMVLQEGKVVVFDFSLRVVIEFSEFSDRNVIKGIAVFEPVASCVRDSCYPCARKTQVTERIFKLTRIHASVNYQIP